MRKLIVGAMIVVHAISCQENDRVKGEYTGREAVYPLLQASAYDIQGTVTFREKNDGSAEITVSLSGTEGNIEHPVHLHPGNTTVNGAEIGALLSPVMGKTGTSLTHLTKLADETPVTYNDLLNLEACIKIHLAADGPNRDMVLAAGNIGASSVDVISGRMGIRVCKSE
jgi:hypothetical protein